MKSEQGLHATGRARAQPLHLSTSATSWRMRGAQSSLQRPSSRAGRAAWPACLLQQGGGPLWRAPALTGREQTPTELAHRWEPKPTMHCQAHKIFTSAHLDSCHNGAPTAKIDVEPPFRVQERQGVCLSPSYPLLKQ